MDKVNSRGILRSQLLVIQGGKGLEGPVSRMGGRQHPFTPSHRNMIWVLIVSKIILLSAIYYFFLR